MGSVQLVEKESEIKINSYKYFDVELWKNWVEQSASFFAGLLDGSIIGILIGESEDQIVLLEKKDSKIQVKTENPEDMERPVADIIFKIKEENIKEILEDSSFIKFIELLSNQKIRVYGLRNQTELMDRGYTGFLGRLGLNFGGSCCGGGSCC
jgi:epoxyqueuosine reductase